VFNRKVIFCSLLILLSGCVAAQVDWNPTLRSTIKDALKVELKPVVDTLSQIQKNDVATKSGRDSKVTNISIAGGSVAFVALCFMILVYRKAKLSFLSCAEGLEEMGSQNIGKEIAKTKAERLGISRFFERHIKRWFKK